MKFSFSFQKKTHLKNTKKITFFFLIFIHKNFFGYRKTLKFSLEKKKKKIKKNENLKKINFFPISYLTASFQNARLYLCISIFEKNQKKILKDPIAQKFFK